jgi:hypothetical protein
MHTRVRYHRSSRSEGRVQVPETEARDRSEDKPTEHEPEEYQSETQNGHYIEPYQMLEAMDVKNK